MATYIVLANYTDQGIRSVKDTTKRADAVRDLAKKFGANGARVLLDLGQPRHRRDLRRSRRCRDDGPQPDHAAAGNVRTQTMRAFFPR